MPATYAHSGGRGFKMIKDPFGALRVRDPRKDIHKFAVRVSGCAGVTRVNPPAQTGRRRRAGRVCLFEAVFVYKHTHARYGQLVKKESKGSPDVMRDRPKQTIFICSRTTKGRTMRQDFRMYPPHPRDANVHGRLADGDAGDGNRGPATAETASTARFGRVRTLQDGVDGRTKFIQRLMRSRTAATAHRRRSHPSAGSKGGPAAASKTPTASRGPAFVAHYRDTRYFERIMDARGDIFCRTARVAASVATGECY
ncbi:hypothetical protein EVAR_50181_1 [Eumeta japonica]|uniref:Uncharacterized protein n=1 Tax=Eumeta variegata TaxID=151549 RepID=A0A4C1X0B0_EUMVA|nr:hypothetical protein EVAR_50181_1 [Eumeta japonica]